MFLFLISFSSRILALIQVDDDLTDFYTFETDPYIFELLVKMIPSSCADLKHLLHAR